MRIERGEANTTLEVLERLAGAVGWDPMDALAGLREPLSEGVRLLLLDEVQQMLERLRNMNRWLQALDPALQAKSPHADGESQGQDDEHRRLRRARVTQGASAAISALKSRLPLEARLPVYAQRGPGVDPCEGER